MNKLKDYNKKRDFDKTNEPTGVDSKKIQKHKGINSKDIGKKNKKRIFVIQHHLARREHYDFRLEWKGVLLSWAVPKGPSFNPKDKRLAVQVEDHPLDYASFEGIIPKGQYGGGSVLIWDEGTWEPITENFEEGLEKGSLKFRLFGKRLVGNWALVRIKDKENSDKSWLLIKENDEFSLEENGISEYNSSVKTGRTIEEIVDDSSIKYKNPFEKVDVQLAVLVNKIPDDDNWYFEIKYDGYRIVSFCEMGKIFLKTRNNHDYSSKFLSVRKSLENWCDTRAMVLDGEIVVTDEEGKTDFQDLQNYIKSPNDKTLSYMVFDILALDGKDLRKKSLKERKEILSSIMKNAPSNLVYSEHIVGSGNKCFKLAEKMGMEGIIGKNPNSIYSGKRSDDWIKMKCYKRQEFVVGGFTLSEKKVDGISSLLLGVFENKDFVFVGRTGTGINFFDVKVLKANFKKLGVETCQFKNIPKSKGKEEIFWLKPELVVEIQYAEITKENILRQASFKGIRTDKSPYDVALEYVEKDEKKFEDEDVADEIALEQKSKSNKENGKSIVCGVEISNPQKIVFKDKGIKKIDVINYYFAVSERMLPFVGNRILSVVRCHNGVSANCFYKKHPTTMSKGVEVVPVVNSEGDEEKYFYIKNKSGIISEVQLGTIEFHIWGSKADNFLFPDMMVFDLDPDENMNLKNVRQGVKDLKSILDELSLKSFLKTSGGKGYHIVVPFKPTVDWKVFHDFSKQVAVLMENKWSERYTSNIRKDSRKGKIFIDWVRNGKGATSVSPYSLRARSGASVSMPIKWSELDKIAPNEIDLNESLKRLKKVDPWKDFFDVKQELR